LFILGAISLIVGYFIYTYLNKQAQNAKLKAQQLAMQLDDAWKQNEALEQKMEQTIVNVPEITEKNTTPTLDELLLILNEKVKIPYANIQCIESVKNDLYIYGNDATNAIHKMRYTLKEVQQLLPIYFKKVQRSYIVNLNYVVKIEKQKAKQIMHLENGMQLSITENLEDILT
jgi:DNA-binding LytR/AlgR family response regulator